MRRRLYCGTFEAEAHWREADLAKLPALPSNGALRMVQAMDQMLFAFCGPEDRVLTMWRMDEAHVQYLRAIGFHCHCNRFDLAPPDSEGDADPGDVSQTVFQRMRQQHLVERVTGFLSGGADLEPFAVVPGTVEAADQYGLGGVFPPQDVIRLVNAKSYSLRMRERLGIANVGVIVEGAHSLQSVGADWLRHGPILVKDEYGVSGKGNQLIAGERGLARLVKHLTTQEADGKRVRFIVEPYLSKSADFSCQFRIAQNGEVRRLAVQELRNQGLAFGASCPARAELLDQLERENYFLLIERIGAKLYEDGYRGDVCVDSMVLKNGALEPLVEINARKSMSLIKYAIDGFLANTDHQGSLTSVAAVYDGKGDFAALLGLLEESQLLFRGDRAYGILPLTVDTLYAREGSAEPMRGKLYVAVAYQQIQQQDDLLAALRQAMQRAGLRVLH